MTSHLLSLLTLLYNSQKSNAEPLAREHWDTSAGENQFYIYATIMRRDTLSYQYHLNDKLWLEKN